MSDNLSEIRTTEDLINAVSTLYFNLNEIERTYYDIFINTTPMDVTLQRYDDQGVLETITVPNRAKDSQSAYTGSGSPEGVVSANMGSHYLDTSSNNIYYKCSGTDAYGWVLMWSSLNLIEGTNFLSPTGDASKLSNLNMSSAGSGILAVGRGGTGVDSITGILKGNGSSAFTTAVDGNDYMGPNSMTGIIAYYPLSTIPTGWLLCNGAAYSRTTYSRLFEALKVYDSTGTTFTLPYGKGDGSTTFNVPNLMGDSTDTKNTGSCFIRCWNGSSAFNTVQYDNVGSHTHTFSGTTDFESGHIHTRGSMNITGRFGFNANGTDVGWNTQVGVNESGNAFYRLNGIGDGGDRWGSGQGGAGFDASRSWVGSTSGGSAHSHSFSGTTGSNTSVAETRVLNKMLVPIIKI